MDEKLLTICVPAYNVEKYIAKNLESYKHNIIENDVEVLIINDGSTDKTREIAAEYENKFPKVYRVIDKENGGHGSTINRGISEAKGKYFKVVDGDDWLTPNGLVEFIKILRNIDVDAIITNYQTVNRDSNEKDEVSYKYLKSNTIYTIEELLEKKEWLCMAAACYKTSILKMNGIRLLENTYYVDEQFNIQPIIYVDTVYYIDIILYNYLIGNPDQSMATLNQVKNLEHRIAVIKENIVFCAGKEQKNNMKYCMKKICGEVGGVYSVCLIDNLNPKQGRKLAQEFKCQIKYLNRGIYNDTLFRYYYPLLLLNLSIVGKNIYKKRTRPI